jgi:DNA repair photolyase
MYTWVTDLWSPIRGCRFSCDYCYIKQFGYGEEVHLNLEDLRTRLGRGKIIFVGHLCDMWGFWVPREDIQKVLNRCRDFPENQYIFQSKDPSAFKEFDFAGLNVMLGTTIETNRYPAGFKTRAPAIEHRVKSMMEIQEEKFVTIEPIMLFDLKSLVEMIRTIRPKFVTIGADSKGHHLIEPSRDEVLELIKELLRFVEIREKKNLGRLLEDGLC